MVHINHIYVNLEYVVHETGLISGPLNVHAPLAEDVEWIIATAAPTTEI